MKRHYIISLMLLWSLGLVVVAQAGPTDPTREPVPPIIEVEEAVENECTGVNLLTNPSFEGNYSSYVPPDGHPDCPAGICTTAQMADGWTPWWRSHNPADDDWIIRMPEYKPAELWHTNPDRVYDGKRAQQYFTFYSTHEAGFYQRVAVTPGEEYCFSIWGHAWSANDDEDSYSGPEHGLLNQRIGVDPTGGTDWQSNQIVWGGSRLQYDDYGLFTLTTVAQSEHLTVFTYSQPGYAMKHNDVYWDKAILAPVQEGSLDPPDGMQFLADEAQAVQARTFGVGLVGPPDLTWTATVSTGGSLPADRVNLITASGNSTEPLSLTIDTSGLAPGTYTTNLTIQTSTAVPGSPATVPLTVVVVPDMIVTHMSILHHP